MEFVLLHSHAKEYNIYFIISKTSEELNHKQQQKNNNTTNERSWLTAKEEDSLPIKK